MDISGKYHNIADWMDGSGPSSDIVISSRIRLARNFAGFPFVTRADNAKRSEIIEFVKVQLSRPFHAGNMSLRMLDDMSDLERSILAERYTITEKLSRESVGSAVAISENESMSVMINEEDHLRMQVFSSGLDIGGIWQRISELDRLISQHAAYAYSEEYGYLTACPTNVGTGIRVSAMLHLPALHITKQIEKVLPRLMRFS